MSPGNLIIFKIKFFHNFWVKNNGFKWNLCGHVFIGSYVWESTLHFRPSSGEPTLKGEYPNKVNLLVNVFVYFPSFDVAAQLLGSLYL